MDDDVYITPKELSRRLAVSSGTLSNWRTRRIGPRFVKLGKAVRYQLADVARWLESQR